MAADTDDAFRQLNDAELAALEQLGVRRAVSADEYLYREGAGARQPGCCLRPPFDRAKHRITPNGRVSGIAYA